ncbi:MAG: FG-GAP repeat protein, partial [Planctomycetes bacterium]|nr:FG-GAP repeat protein [Planctomycetota bacterium]
MDYRHDTRLTEWYRNAATGFEHGFTLHARPGTCGGEIRFELRLRGDLTPTVFAGGRSVRFEDRAGVHVLDYAGLVAFDADGMDLPARIERTHEGLRIAVDDTGARYPLTVDPVVQQAYLKASNTATSDEFGSAIAVSGDTIVVGAPNEDSGATGVDGDGSDDSVMNSGAAYVFVRSGGVWSQQAYLKASNPDASDLFGTSVAVSGDTIVVGAHLEDSAATGLGGDQNDNSAAGAGAAYVFVRSGGVWAQQAYLKASNTAPMDYFGYSVAVSGDTVLVGAYGEDSSATGVNGDETDNSLNGVGAAYVFVRSGSNWSQQAYLKASNSGGGDYFGWSVAIDADTAVVGAWREDSSATGANGNEADNTSPNAGAAYVFARSGTVWTQQAYLKASNTGAGDEFGSSVAVAGDTVVVGAPSEDSAASGVDGDGTNNSAGASGAAYVFSRSGSTWSQQAYLKASNPDASDEFGTSVGVTGDSVVVGAPFEESAATGVNGDQSDDSLSATGAAYVFTRSGPSWVQEAYLKPSNSGRGDNFGWSVAVSGNTVAVGAKSEDSMATGVNGDDSDDSQQQSGAAYVFVLPDLGGCVGAIQPSLTSPASATSS